MIPSFWRDQVTRLRAPVIKDRNNNIYDWDNAESLVINRGYVESNSTSENNQNREATLAVYRVWLPSGSDVLATDRIRIPDEDTEFEIIGEPIRRRSATGRINHIELLLQRWKG